MAWTGWLDSTRLITLQRSQTRSVAYYLNAPEDAVVLVVANPGENGTTVNLLAPIVVNVATKICAQIILEDQEWPLQAHLTARSAVRSA
jgi:flagellar assembly factor FliW